jgi:hypothetical protein
MATATPAACSDDVITAIHSLSGRDLSGDSTAYSWVKVAPSSSRPFGGEFGAGRDQLAMRSA